MIALIIIVGLFALIMFISAWAEDHTCPKCGGLMLEVYGWNKEECKMCGYSRKC